MLSCGSGVGVVVLKYCHYVRGEVTLWTWRACVLEVSSTGVYPALLFVCVCSGEKDGVCVALVCRSWGDFHFRHFPLREGVTPCVKWEC